MRDRTLHAVIRVFENRWVRRLNQVGVELAESRRFWHRVVRTERKRRRLVVDDAGTRVALLPVLVASLRSPADHRRH